MIELRHVSKSYGAGLGVEDVSFTVAAGQLCALVGSSGSGKSTTLKMVNRLLPVSSGTIRIDGEDIARQPAETLRRRIGYAIQSVGLFPHWTVEDNIATVPRLLHWPEARVRDRVAELLNLLRLDPETVRGKYPHQLSGGQQQRVGVARALAADPAILLMDEPFGALDPITRDALRAEFAQIHRATGKTILFVTHDMDEALALADIVAIMDRGRLVQFGTPLEILTRPANDFVRDFIGRSELGLKLLSLARVEDRLRGGEGGEGEAIEARASLREALSLMAQLHIDRLPVRDAQGRIAGAIHLGDIIAR